MVAEAANRVTITIKTNLAFNIYFHKRQALYVGCVQY